MTKNICLDCRFLTITEPNGTYAVCDKKKWIGRQPVGLLVSIIDEECDDFKVVNWWSEE